MAVFGTYVAIPNKIRDHQRALEQAGIERIADGGLLADQLYIRTNLSVWRRFVCSLPNTSCVGGRKRN